MMIIMIIIGETNDPGDGNFTVSEEDNTLSD